MSSSDYSQTSVQALLKAVQDLAPSSFPPNSWYIIAAAALASVGRGDAYGDLYRYVTAQYSDSPFDVENRQNVSQRLRETIIKSWTLIGMPRAISASYSLQAADKEGDAFVKHKRADLLPQPDLLFKRAQDWFGKAFAEDEHKIFAGFNAHKEMEWTLYNIVYGLFLADLEVFTPIENEFIVLACVMTTGGVKSPTLSHLKVMRRLGLSAPDTEKVQLICEMIAQWAGQDTAGWPRAKEVEQYFQNDS